MTERITTEAQARKKGFTREVCAASLDDTLNLLIAPDTDLDSEFEAFDLCALELISVKGWMGDFYEI